MFTEFTEHGIEEMAAYLQAWGTGKFVVKYFCFVITDSILKIYACNLYTHK